MSAIQQRHLLEVLQAQIEKIPDADRAPEYQKQLREHLVTVLAHEREHRTRGTNIKSNITAQIEALADCLIHGDGFSGRMF